LRFSLRQPPTRLLAMITLFVFSWAPALIGIDAPGTDSSTPFD
jgi:hypothetical protein